MGQDGDRGRKAGGSGKAGNPDVSLDRIRAIIGMVELDCACREKLDVALARFETLERRRALRGLIHDARQQCERIAAMLDLLRELDELPVEEPDITVFTELALLFDTIGEAARRGGEDLRRFEALAAAP
ncbi:MAG: hypothetical protein LDL25_09810 [Hyphomicrobiales bacterium]|uniref:hypothetical protein n=1 Tax=Rhabdaerophilum calidifontis TaxID=2604328 RepID=UPI0012384B8A|nr:hypothetical protein [Rhabdaerophilum calidifontis]MCA1953380.1 hypothetical protein [Hyphomicrobiales bacterium]MCA2000072.1 hypothetical protein [Hyphomicrobiales bacterium]